MHEGSHAYDHIANNGAQYGLKTLVSSLLELL
jgi:hypothetical protein